MPRFFFWSGGTLLQKSIEGLLRSLIWQILQQSRNTAAALLVRLGKWNSTFQSSTAVAAWTSRRLRTAFEDTLQQALRLHRLCFLIDGLDEYEGDQDVLINFIQDIIKNVGVKVCLSSRPDRTLDEAFGSSAKLRLQDLTENDIRKFVIDKLQSVPQTHYVGLQDPNLLNNVKEKIVRRAQGVFLWVSLAVKDQIRGLRNDDSPQQLTERLDCLPNEVEGIYQRMLDHIEKPHRRQAAHWLRVVLCLKSNPYRTLSILDLVLLSQEQLDDMAGSPARMPELELVVASFRTWRRIGTVCAGLLEVHEEREVSKIIRLHYEAEYTGEAFSSLLYLFQTTVDFVHRTALDFMQDRERGWAFLEKYPSSTFTPQFAVARLLIAELKLFGPHDSTIAFVMEEIYRAEIETGVAQPRLCELLDNTMHSIDRTEAEMATSSHWSARWGLIRHGHIKQPRSLQGLRSSSSQTQVSNKDCIQEGLQQRDFLTLAASSGLLLHVQHALRNYTAPLDTDTASRLLYWSIFSIDSKVVSGLRPAHQILPPLSLANEFLKRGGNPNLGASPSTTWIWFLLAMLYYLHIFQYSDKQSFDLDEAEKIDIQRAFMRTTLAFIENGADLHVTCSSSMYSLELDESRVSFKVHLSALVIIKLCLLDQPEIFRVINKGNAEGARYYSKCTQLAVWIDDRPYHIRGYQEKGHEESVEQRTFHQKGFNQQEDRDVKRDSSSRAFDAYTHDDQEFSQEGDERACFSDSQDNFGQEGERVEKAKGPLAFGSSVHDDQEDVHRGEAWIFLSWRPPRMGHLKVYDVREEESATFLEFFLRRPKLQANSRYWHRIHDLADEIQENRTEPSREIADPWLF
ncbi:MAG: hypothetical protein Q9191_002639 [Dirinaria sp. TL-2023a]